MYSYFLFEISTLTFHDIRVIETYTDNFFFSHCIMDSSSLPSFWRSSYSEVISSIIAKLDMAKNIDLNMWLKNICPLFIYYLWQKLSGKHCQWVETAHYKTPLYCWQTSNDKNSLQTNAYKGFNWTHFRISLHIFDKVHTSL